MSDGIITKEELEKIGTQGELLGLLKARTICDQRIAVLIEMMNEPDRDRIDRNFCKMYIDSIRDIITSIDAVMDSIHSR